MSKPHEEEISHGRGGAGNIAPDETKYADGEITRSGVEGSHGDGAFSTGRGGAANIGDVGAKNGGLRTDHDIVPEAATRPSRDGSDHHVGRGGAGNVEKAKADGTHPKSVADKLKSKMFGVFSKKEKA